MTTLEFDTAYHSFDGEVEASTTPTICRLLDLHRHQLSTIAPNSALAEENHEIWIALDRLDVAFSNHAQLESNALRALFRVYLDMEGLNQVKLKIFLRSDIWAQVTDDKEGFREASHITSHTTIEWDRSALLNLIVRRALHNDAVCKAYNVKATLVDDSFEKQEAFFFRMFPPQIDLGSNKPNTFDWVLSRTRDGTKVNAPRELIHFFNALRDVEVKKAERQDFLQEDGHLFSRASFKESLPVVSKVRIQQTLYAEFPKEKPWIESLKELKTSHSVASLAKAWGVYEDEASIRAKALLKIGFFELRGSREDPEYWIPFIYRDELQLVQGTADA